MVQATNLAPTSRTRFIFSKSTSISVLLLVYTAESVCLLSSVFLSKWFVQFCVCVELYHNFQASLFPYRSTNLTTYHPIWKTGYFSLFGKHLSTSHMGDPTNSYVTASTASEASSSHNPPTPASKVWLRSRRKNRFFFVTNIDMKIIYVYISRDVYTFRIRLLSNTLLPIEQWSGWAQEPPTGIELRSYGLWRTDCIIPVPDIGSAPREHHFLSSAANTKFLVHVHTLCIHYFFILFWNKNYVYAKMA
jgi:hypothetical protein